MKLKLITVVAKWLFVLMIPLFLLAIIIQVGSREAIKLYEYNFDKYDASWGITQNTGLEKAVVIQAAEKLFTYFHSNEEMVRITVLKNGQQMNLFNEKEQIHLKDVKNLMRIGPYLLGISLAYILIYILSILICRRFEKLVLVQSLFTGGIITLGLIIVFGIVAAANPEQIFLQFHYISFSNPYWLLDPATDYLIMMFPESYFFDIGLYGIITIIVEALILVSASKLILKRYFPVLY